MFVVFLKLWDLNPKKGLGSTCLTYTGFLGELEHRQIETRLIDESFGNVAHFDPIGVDYLDDIEVVCQENYKKTLVHATVSLTHIECDVMFIMCVMLQFCRGRCRP